MSDMTGSKALYLEDWCQQTGRDFLRFDQSGHGASSGDFTEGGISAWSEDSLAVIDALTDGPQILVGSSMGGWVMLHCALARPERIVGLVGIAPAPDFTEDLMWQGFTQEQQKTVMEQGLLELPSEYSDSPYRISRHLIEDGRKNLLLREAIPLDLPVRIIQGLRDDAVPWQRALTLQDKLTSEDVAVTLIKDGEHRLSRPGDLKALTDAIEAVTLALTPEAAESPAVP